MPFSCGIQNILCFISTVLKEDRIKIVISSETTERDLNCRQFKQELWQE